MSLPIHRWPAQADDPDLLARLAPGNEGLPDEAVDAATQIVRAVRDNGDAALIDFTKRFDSVELTTETLRVSVDTIAKHAAEAPQALRDAIMHAADNIRRFHDPQRRADYDVSSVGGASLSLHWRAVSAAALYVPGGRAAYPTSVLMNGIPAQVAGVPRIAAYTVPGTVESNPAVAFALEHLGITEVYRVAGAQAIAAAAYGTATIPPVDVIVGPGNAYVAAAKQRVFGRVGIDSIAGPSEVLVLCDDSANPDFVALDLLAQAEHDPLARCVIASTNIEILERVDERLQTLLSESTRGAIVRSAWEGHGLRILADSVDDLVAICKRMAPEHLQVILRESVAPDRLVAGAIFYGNYTPTAVGDYIAGPNHVLPTGGAARFSGPLGVQTFLRPTSIVRGTQAMMQSLGDKAALIADYERLPAHAAALRARVSR